MQTGVAEYTHIIFVNIYVLTHAHTQAMFHIRSRCRLKYPALQAYPDYTFAKKATLYFFAGSIIKSFVV